MDLNWNANDIRRGKTVLTTLDAHAADEPLRIVTGGLGPLPGETISIESVLARRSVPAGRQAGSRGTVAGEVSGSAHLTGRHEFLLDPAHPLAEGFLIAPEPLA